MSTLSNLETVAKEKVKAEIALDNGDDSNYESYMNNTLGLPYKKEVGKITCKVCNELVKSHALGMCKKCYYQQYHQNVTLGRFPANFIHDGSEEVKSLFPNTTSGYMSEKNERHTDGSPNGIYGKFDKNHPLGETYGDSGSAARFFYTAKASQNERNWGLGEFDEKYTASAEFRPNHMEKALDGESGNPFGRWQPKKNIHPTVKPIDLMRYLVRLVTPKGGVCLDPYLGSGTTAIACKAEKFDYIGIEMEEEYARIAEARIKAETVVYDIFDFMGEENNEKD
jgi:hypothetical protein